MMKVAVFPNPWSTSWFRENLQQGGYYGERRTVSEEAGFINCLGARSEDMVSGATCLDKPDPPDHQEVRTPRKHSSVPVKAARIMILISEKDYCDRQQKII